MESRITYREVKENDKNQYFDLLREVRIELERIGTPEFLRMQQEFLDKLFDKNYARNIGAFYEEKMVAIVSLKLNQNNIKIKSYKEKIGIMNKNVCELGNFLVLPEYRGNGIAKTIFYTIIDLAIKLKYEVVIATVHPNNIASKTILEKEFYFAGNITIQGYPRLLFRKNL